jgi:hypothetical protein
MPLTQLLAGSLVSATICAARRQRGEIDLALALEGDRNHVTIMYLRQANHLRKGKLDGLDIARSWGGRRTG